MNTPETIRETPQSPLDWFCANCGRDYPSLNIHGRCTVCDSNQVSQTAKPKETASSRFAAML